MCERRPWVTDLFLEDYKVAVLQQTLISDHCVEEGKKRRKRRNKRAKHHSLYGDSAANINKIIKLCDLWGWLHLQGVLWEQD